MEESRANALFQMRKSVEKLGVRRRDDDEILDRAIDGAGEGSEDVRAVEEVEGGDGSGGIRVRIGGCGGVGSEEDFLAGIVEEGTGRGDCEEFVVHLLDKVIASGCKGREIGNEKWIAIVDLHQISYKNVDPRGLITGFQFLQNYYPERLGKCFILNMPWFFVSIWRMVSRFVDSATLKNILIVSNEEERRIMIEEVGEVLPVEYGGKAKLIALQDAIIIPHLDA